MPRTKGSTNKNVSNKPKVDNGEPKVTKPRGRQKGQKIEKEPVVIVSLSDKYRVKIDKYGKCLQEKGEPKEGEQLEKVDTEDIGWKNPKYLSTWEQVFKYLVNELSRQKAKKEEVMPFERYLEYFEKARKEVNKMFANIDEVKMK